MLLTHLHVATTVKVSNWSHVCTYFILVTTYQGDLCESPLPPKTVRGRAGEIVRCILAVGECTEICFFSPTASKSGVAKTSKKATHVTGTTGVSKTQGTVCE